MTKDDRLQIRVGPAEKRLLEKAIDRPQKRGEDDDDQSRDQQWEPEPQRSPQGHRIHGGTSMSVSARDRFGVNV